MADQNLPDDEKNAYVKFKALYKKAPLRFEKRVQHLLDTGGIMLGIFFVIFIQLQESLEPILYNSFVLAILLLFISFAFFLTGCLLPLELPSKESIGKQTSSTPTYRKKLTSLEKIIFSWQVIFIIIPLTSFLIAMGIIGILFVKIYIVPEIFLTTLIILILIATIIILSLKMLYTQLKPIYKENKSSLKHQAIGIVYFGVMLIIFLINVIFIWFSP